MLKKLVSKILVLALCASTLAALPQSACASEREEPTPVMIVEPEDPMLPNEPSEPGKPEEPLECKSEFPDLPGGEATE